MKSNNHTTSFWKKNGGDIFLMVVFFISICLGSLWIGIMHASDGITYEEKCKADPSFEHFTSTVLFLSIAGFVYVSTNIFRSIADLAEDTIKK